MTSRDSQGYLSARTSALTTAILLDVENFCLKIDLVEHLQFYCSYPITIKFAVANWQNSAIANLDLYLHQQRYQLIHVPKAKNAADGQILTLGTSLLWQYPQIAEIVIVSQDGIFDYLHQTLQALGCRTYKVYQQSGHICIQDFVNARTDYITVDLNKNKAENKTIENKELDNQIAQKKTEATANKSQKNNNSNTQSDYQKIAQEKIKLTLNELKKNSQQPITISALTQEYHKNNQQSLSEYLKKHKLASSVLKFLKTNCSDQIDIKQKNSNYYLSLK
ncbi:hypothetical protein NIES4102_14260 [Chondrocystis sp. NIES-4102]|nr:hypothetical protein NIES4102_14260 [Chondrocystis sp. NIES-4102]